MKNVFDSMRFKTSDPQVEKVMYSQSIELLKLITALEKQFKTDVFSFLNKQMRYEYALIILEFAEDLHKDAKFWSVVEEHNIALFDTPLPFFLKAGERIKSVFDVNRFKFFLYNMQMYPYQISTYSPNNPDLDLFARKIAEFCENFFKTVPLNTLLRSIEDLSEVNYFDIQFNLKILSGNLYLFRGLFSRMNEENINDKKADFSLLSEQYVFEKTTTWSGLGVIDVFLSKNKLTENLQKDVRSWNKRITSYFVVKSFQNDLIIFQNLLNNEEYSVLKSCFEYNFQKDDLIYGQIAPFDGYYYFTHSPEFVDENDNNKIAEIVNVFAEENIELNLRSNKTKLQTIYDELKQANVRFVEFFQNDWIYVDNFTDLNQIEKQFGDYLADNKNVYSEEDKLFEETNSSDNSKLDDTICVFFNPHFGLEALTNFDLFKSGMEKKGKNLTNDETLNILSVIAMGSISPEFILRAVKEFGDESIARVFSINKEETPDYLPFLLRKFKGNHFKERYPNYR